MAASRTATSTIRPLARLGDDAFDYAAAAHLLSRAGFGGTPDEIRELAALGLDGALDRLLGFEGAPPDLPGGGFDSEIMTPPSPEARREYQRARQRGDEAAVADFRRMRQERQRRDRRQMAEIRRWWIDRLVRTTRPLEEKMTLFWHGHFATGYRAIEDSWHMYRQNVLFREYAFGNFRELTHRVIRDPAMLRYLNNNRNVRSRPNENLARELMELFTLGEGNGYTEADIKEGARALTGYSYDDDDFVFRNRVHDPGSKRILGRSGTFDGDDFVEIIFDQPAAAEFLVLKLYKFFVHDLPGGEIDAERRRVLVALADRFRRSDFDVGALLRAMFASEHFYAASNRGVRIKSPVELVVGTVRSLGTPPRSTRATEDALGAMGQDLLEPPSVKGWPGGRAWINTSTLFVRQNFVLHLLTGRRPREYGWPNDRTPYDPQPLIAPVLELEGEDASAETIASFLMHHALGRPAHPSRIDTIAGFLAERNRPTAPDALIGALCLITGLPEYQLS